MSNHASIIDGKPEMAHAEHVDERGEKHLDPDAVEAAIHGHDKKWERRTIRKIDFRLLIIRTFNHFCHAFC